MKKLMLLVAAVAALSGCTDAKIGKMLSLGDSAHVQCWSGDTKIYDGVSSGKVENSVQSDGYYFTDRADRKLKEVSGNCVVTYLD